MLTYAARMRGEFGDSPKNSPNSGTVPKFSRYNEDAAACDAGVNRDD